jgi:hypothetical protein
LVNTDESELALYRAERRVREIQTKLHRWARDDSHRRFDDLHNLVADPAFLLVAWDRVRGNKGARTAGVDGQTVSYVQMVRGVEWASRGSSTSCGRSCATVASAPGVFVITMTAHVLVMIAFLYAIATGAQGRVLLALGIAVVASGGWVV